MTWQTESEFESREGVVRAVYSTESNAVYYITDVSNEANDWDGDGFIVSYWPNRNKTIETVTLVESCDTREEANDVLREKTDESVV